MPCDCAVPGHGSLAAGGCSVDRQQVRRSIVPVNAVLAMLRIGQLSFEGCDAHECVGVAMSVVTKKRGSRHGG